MYDRVISPEKYEPKTSAIYALNDIDVKAAPQVVSKTMNVPDESKLRQIVCRISA
jgi:hypothetical protein